MKPLLFALAIAALAFLLEEPSDGQVLYSTIVGQVLDSSGASVNQAIVTITSSETNQVRTTTTNESGSFSFSNVIPGTYQLKVGAQGFQEYTETGVRATVNNIARVDIQLRVGGVTEAVSVSAAATALQTDKADVHTEFAPKEIEDLPLSGYRNYQTLTNLVPGATPGQFQNSINDVPQRDLTTNVNGTNRNNNVTYVDGALNKMNVINTHTLYVPPIESIEAINITTNAFDAEQGMAGGSATIVVTKSGTNDLHGAVFEFNANNATQARNFFYQGSKAPKSLDNMYGAALGGPIKKNHLFFFGDWEGLREGKNFSQLSTVPTSDQRIGDFSKYGVTLYNPQTGNANGTGRAPFAGAVIPQSMRSAISQKLLTLVPLPNLPGTSANYFSSGTQVLNRDSYDLKMDWNRTDKHTIWGKYSRMDATVLCPNVLGAAGGAGLCLGGKAGHADTTVQMATLGTTWTLSPTLLLDGTLGYFRLVQNIVGPNYGQNVGLDFLGIPGTNGPDVRQSGIPIFDITGYQSLGDSGLGIANPGFRTDAGYTHTSNLNWNHGRHSFRFGFELIRYQQNDWQANSVGSVRGEFRFSGGASALSGGPAPGQFNAFADFIMGLPISVAKDIQVYIPQTAREWQFAWYAQDRWQVTPKLTVSLGVRYEYYPIFTRVDHGIERYDPNTNQVLIGGLGGNPENTGIDVSKKLLAQRIGLAYRMGSSTVLRAGYGVATDPTSTWSIIQRLYPSAYGTQFVGPNSFTPFQPLEAGIPAIPVPNIKSGSVPLPVGVVESTLAPGLFKRGYIESWNFSVERKLPGDIAAAVAYVGTRTVRQIVGVDINAGVPGLGTAGQPLFVQFGRTAATRVMDPAYDANYHALQATLNRRFVRGLFIKASYTFSHAIDYTDDVAGSLIFNTPDQIQRNRALAGYDRTHVLQFSSIYESPFGPNRLWLKNGGALSAILRNWQINGLFSAYSGTPITITASATSLNAPGNTQTADQVGPITILGGIGTGTPWFDPTSFRSVTAVRYGTTGRDILRGPGIANFDAGLFRSFQVSERFSVQFRAEAFNTSNTPHFDNPNANVSTPSSFGTITSASLQDQRFFRFGLRVAF